MYYLPDVEFYITNVCNLNCGRCNRYNNYAFTGHQRWNDFKDQYQEWAKILNIRLEIRIIGGEPMGNPDFLDWVHGIANLWPDVSIRIISNGTQLANWPTLYEVLKSYQGRIILEISDHNRAEKNITLAKIKNFLTAPIKTKNLQTEVLVNEGRRSLNEYLKLPPEDRDRTVFTDSNNVSINYYPAWQFTAAPVNYNTSTQQFDFFNSNPVIAARHCPQIMCHQFSKGMLYKCPQVTVWPDFIQQFPTSLSDSDKQLINSYEPACYDWEESKLDNFFKSLHDNDAIPQCKFCPENYKYGEIVTSNKKIPIRKIDD